MTFDLKNSVIDTDLPFPKRRGKVRDVYDMGDRLLIISTDRISAFDWVLPVGVPGKGVVLTQLSRFWFERLDVPHHMISTDIAHFEGISRNQFGPLMGRVMLARKAEVIPYECVVRGYLEGSGWREYQSTGSVCGIALPTGLRQCEQLPEPIFTPATKAVQGHDENVTFAHMAKDIGTELASALREKSLQVYRQGSQMAMEKGIVIADTKFEWGWCNQELTLIDEVLTPDSSRFWSAEQYAPGHPQPSYDKQFVRQWLMASNWDQQSPPPALPDDIIQQTREKYFKVYELLTGVCLPDASLNPSGDH